MGWEINRKWYWEIERKNKGRDYDIKYSMEDKEK